MDVDYCDFIGWTERDMQIEGINPDVEFWELALIKAKKFFSLCILPELIGKWYTLVDDVDGDEEESPWCYCQTDIEGRRLIGCDNPECGKGKWFCPTCWRNE